ncbi:MAG: type I 3-dehydroquinate dehydratase [Thermodesulfovibrionales bacterium]|nr:type I 3-dehydroquinate dehydratase [Thermodesulfovibrionales bacterium]
MTPKLKAFLSIHPPPLIACVLDDRDVHEIIENSVSAVDLVELRIDLFEEISPKYVVKMVKNAKEKFKKPIIATIRDVSEGGQKEVPDRLSLYRAVMPFSDLLDVEISFENLLREIKAIISDKTLLIGSYHNFDITPFDEYLESIIDKATTLGVDITKIAVKANSRDDLIRLSLFTLNYQKRGIVTISMGQEGLPSRVVMPLFGSIIVYGYISKPYAPGQLSIMQLTEVFSLLNIR